MDYHIQFYSLTTFIFILGACKRFKVNRTYVFFFFLIFNFYNLSLCISRQFAAASIVLYAYSFLIEKGRKKYCFFPLILFSTGIHVTAFTAIIFYFLCRINFYKINPIILLIIVVFAFISVKTFARPFVEWVNIYSMNIDEEFVGYRSYFEMTVMAEKSVNGAIVSFLGYLMSTFIFLGLINKDDERTRVISTVFLFGILISIFFSDIHGNLGRLKYALTIINIIAYSYYFMYDKSKKKIVVLLTCTLLFGFLYIWNMAYAGASGTVPYSFMF